MDLQQIIQQSFRWNDAIYPDVFTETTGLDIVLPEKKLHAVPTWGTTRNPKRSARLKISTWVGMDMSAEHYYGKIEIMGVRMEYDDKPGVSTSVSREKYPLAQYSYTLTLLRPLTQKEIDANPDRWRCYEAGALTECFESEAEIVELAKEVFKARFTGDWDFYIEYSAGLKEKVDTRPKTIKAQLIDVGRKKVNKTVEVRDMEELCQEVHKCLWSREVSLEETDTPGELKVYAGCYCVGKVRIIEQSNE